MPGFLRESFGFLECACVGAHRYSPRTLSHTFGRYSCVLFFFASFLRGSPAEKGGGEKKAQSLVAVGSEEKEQKKESKYTAANKGIGVRSYYFSKRGLIFPLFWLPEGKRRRKRNSISDISEPEEKAGGN